MPATGTGCDAAASYRRMKVTQAQRKRRRPSSGQQPEPRLPFARQHQRAPGLEKRLHPRPRFRAPNYRAAGKLEGKIALITGGDSGIGRAVACLYAREGADVAINFLRQETPDALETQRVIEALGRRCLLLGGDLTREKTAAEIVDRTVKEFGQLDILVSNAAHQSHKETVMDVTVQELHETYETNVFACVRLVQVALPHLRPGSAIIVTSSETGIVGSEGLQDYASTKGAINALVKTLSMELIKQGIRINAVAPGPVWTPLNPSDRGRSAKEVANFGKDTPMKRPAQPEELSPAYVFLASEADSSYITGIVLPVMGGTTIGG
jgi:NAD(P)-dependent dehydrogenase (short-subunit alcohol dehydrogenase family)